MFEPLSGIATRQTGTMICPRCQHSLRDTAQFCDGCGLSLDAYNTPTERLDPRRRDGPAPPDDPLVGRLLDSRYELVARLGEGGMGAVYRARRRHIGDEVAVKILLKQYVASAEASERFRREARAAALLRHPNVVGIYDFGEAQGEDAPAYIVMELVEGVSLRDLIRREGKLRPERAVSLMRDICAGVGAAHKRGIVHRDLKPDNIIVLPLQEVDERESVKVVDFGIAKLRDVQSGLSLTQTGAVLGTPYYMSPEQCRGEPLDARSDVYSLGVMLYEMLTGLPPFSGTTIAGLITKHLTEAPPSISLQPGVSAALDEVYKRALAKEKNARQADATVLSRELQRALASASNPPVAYAPVTVGPPQTVPSLRETLGQSPSFRPQTQPNGKSRRVWWVAGGLMVLILGVIAIGAALKLMPGETRNASKSSSAGPANTSLPPGSDSTTGAQPSSAERGSDDSNTDGPGGIGAGELDMKGRWTGTTGPSGQAAVLVISESRGDAFKGVLEQGNFRISVNGSVNTKTRQVTIQETRVLKGEGWSLGKGTGEISTDWQTMTGTGSDEIGGPLGVTYDWSFSKR
jgi:serine/threonine protein kinase